MINSDTFTECPFSSAFVESFVASVDVKNFPVLTGTVSASKNILHEMWLRAVVTATADGPHIENPNTRSS